jgi:hypothetical protein
VVVGTSVCRRLDRCFKPRTWRRLSWLLNDGRRQPLSLVPPVHRDWWDCRRGRPDDGGADPGSVADAGLILPRFVHCEADGGLCLAAWKPRRRPWKVVRLVGPPAGAMAVVVAIPPGRVGGMRLAVGGSGRSLVFGSGGAPIWSWGSGPATPLLKTSWWHGGATERKLCALLPTTATLVGAVIFLKTSSWCSSPCLGSG